MRLAATVTVLLLVSLSGCGGDAGDGPGDAGKTPSPARSAAFLLDFETGLDVGAEVDTVENTGPADVQTQVRATGGAAVTVVKGPDGGHAVQFPAYTGQAAAPAAVLVATDGGGGALDPGSEQFTFGATFRLDQTSSGSEADNGDNLVQRGTFDSPGQLKLQLDHDVPSCRVKGDAGEAFVKADGPVDTDTWYSVTCERNGSDVELTVKPFDEDKGETSAAGAGTWHVSAPTGTLDFAGAPLTVGGKTGPDGTPVASADQFNGAVDDVFLQVK